MITNSQTQRELKFNIQNNPNCKIDLNGKFIKLVQDQVFLIGESLHEKNIIHDESIEIKKRQSFLNFNNIKLSYISKTHDTIEPYSSSDEEIDEGIRFKSHPTVKDVCEAIIDTNTLMIIVIFIY